MLGGRKAYFFACIFAQRADHHGGGVVTLSNLRQLQYIVGKDKVTVIDLRIYKKLRLYGTLLRVIRLLCVLLFNRLILSDKIKKALRFVSAGDILFVDSSLYGQYVRWLRKRYPRAIIMTHFHNIELSMYRMSLRSLSFSGLVGFPMRSLLIFIAHRLSVLCSDGLLFLNVEEERKVIAQYPNRKLLSQSIVPIVKDVWQEKCISTYSHNIPTLVFVGSAYYANTEGIKWFIRKVMPYVDARLRIVGKGVSASMLPVRENVEVVGEVDDLSPYYYDADVVVCPLFKGAGLKVKVLEACMYGKNIMGTPLAFSGFDIDYRRIGGLCGTASEFIAAINDYARTDFNRTRHNAYARKLYETRYAEATGREVMASFIQRIADSIDTNNNERG